MGISQGRVGEEEEGKERLKKGDIVVVPFPFSDLSDIKVRPALVVASLSGEDVILCMITSSPKYGQGYIEINDSDLDEGYFQEKSYIRPARLFTIDCNRILYKIGSFKDNLTNKAVDALISILTASD
jgi:mRNA interferase MazF